MSVPVNYHAILVAAFASIVLGFLWYGPFFGKPWMKLMGITKESMQGAKKDMTKTYALMIVTTLLTAYILSHLTVFATTYMNTSGVAGGLSSGFWIWLGIAVPLIMDGQLWEKKPWKLFYINAGYRLASFLIMGAILAGWTM